MVNYEKLVELGYSVTITGERNSIEVTVRNARTRTVIYHVTWIDTMLCTDMEDGTQTIEHIGRESFFKDAKYLLEKIYRELTV